ncbi:MAG: NAD-dependent epimerase/dehydratase family protein [Planctomycetota bacterium]
MLSISNPASLDEHLSRPDAGVLETLQRTDGDFLVAGAGGKMGSSVCRMLRRTLNTLGRQSTEVYAVSRFSNPQTSAALRQDGIRTLSCDLLDRQAVASLPDVSSVIFMAGQKFGTADAPEQTWAVNALLPAFVAERFASTSMVVFSTGCVYPLTAIAGSGSREDDPLLPPGEYAASCVGRERMMAYYSQRNRMPALLFRLCYAVELRYGVLVDIAQRVFSGETVDLRMGWVQIIWQRDAAARAIRSFDFVASPPVALNVTGPERLSVRWLALQFADRFRKEALFAGNEADSAWLWDASKATQLFGPPETPLVEILDAVADWILRGGATLGKPTRFEVQDGNY